MLEARPVADDLGGRNGNAGDEAPVARGRLDQRGDRFLRQVGVRQHEPARGDDIAERPALQLSRREQPVEFHVGERDHQIAVVFKDRGVARRLAIEKSEGAVDDPCYGRRRRHHLAGGIAAASADHAHAMAKARKVAGRVEAATASLFEPGAGIAGTRCGRPRYAAAPVDMRSAEDGDFSFRHECSSAWPIGRNICWLSAMAEVEIPRTHAPDLFVSGESAKP
ncbi:hypothetical protein D9M70_480990 [compost metagenome]